MTGVRLHTAATLPLLFTAFMVGVVPALPQTPLTLEDDIERAQGETADAPARKRLSAVHRVRYWWSLLGRSCPKQIALPPFSRPGRDGAAADAWVDVFRTAFGGKIVWSADIQQCAADRFQNADLIVLSMGADDNAHSRFGAIVQVLKECVHPVLFVPSADGIFERSSS